MSLIKNCTTATLAASALAFGLSTSAMAQDAPAVNTGAISVDAGVDWTSAYYFRGIAQENQGLILQPYATVTVDLYEDDTFTVAGYVGTWNSFQYNDAASNDPWYEQDVFVGVTVGLPEGLTLDVSYVNYYSPRGGAGFAEEFAFVLGYDDSELLGEFAFSPYALLALEFDGGADGGADTGTYLELGGEFALNVLQSEDYPVDLTIPFAVGFSIADYYESGNAGDEDFGFIQVGLVASTPLAFIPAEYGEWSASAGIHLLFMGDAASDIGEGVVHGSGDVVPIGTVGISLSY
ncbi:TorF family putative porin [Mucisphaera sp.]|uniref:TorF family putative porin n=1 Tax=Mucisphaera sp. TaxID=2913024 RepID=UPI003D13EE39